MQIAAAFLVKRIRQGMAEVVLSPEEISPTQYDKDTEEGRHNLSGMFDASHIYDGKEHEERQEDAFRSNQSHDKAGQGK
ncbi:MAG: hypothetical protein GTN69_09800 [Armatimonadetes bacterium]|nr:hypothetical protein [Armatimonadota bacterium]NIO76151.1 hypothetical protein [Armatimonadota bacterium]NIO98847.1 hypothetical protein [Armatimonadota bacterium]